MFFGWSTCCIYYLLPQVSFSSTCWRRQFFPSVISTSISGKDKGHLFETSPCPMDYMSIYMSNGIGVKARTQPSEILWSTCTGPEAARMKFTCFFLSVFHLLWTFLSPQNLVERDTRFPILFFLLSVWLSEYLLLPQLTSRWRTWLWGSSLNGENFHHQK